MTVTLAVSNEKSSAYISRQHQLFIGLTAVNSKPPTATVIIHFTFRQFSSLKFYIIIIINTA